MDNQTDKDSTYFELRNYVGEPSGLVIQSRFYPDGRIELWTCAQYPILSGPRRGQAASIWVKLDTTDVADAFTRFEELVDKEEPAAKASLQKQLDDEANKPPPIALPSGINRGRRFR